ncbi:LLM class flavin-dependent oxidoreductase [Rhodococcus sp. 06-412-2C]|uniref:LLM class flavin-dependent oxidoreductase n=1 Tax=unclassified Rhodococcus (in: high G+C Gram-positive bacteria) TaxID=192944 RepID=UPI000B9B5D6B|nr:MULTISPECIES: LLM class flavin-dependent oxidoreductase [unclassified Rhodococcus (in: high G+C Gram-positive bacteria)]OZC90655.1 LLM class flavin-dependent oxidoreductase [Rhodococcus sp. 06-412-2C]OZC98089.1 LLM class flavin-dependent oxidoreductase [Rhodococcus sp. 06-412-2B]
MAGTLYFALELDGYDESSERLRSDVADAERAGFTVVTFGDSLVSARNRLDAGTRAAFVASTTSTIGLAPTVHTVTTEPFFLATQLASLDHASHGRGAWVIGADNSPAAHAAVGSDVRSSVTAEIRDVIDVSRRLWDSWEDDAVIRDAGTGRYLDPAKVHHVRFEGEFFDVVGPLITPRSPQGQVVVVGDADLGVTDLLDVALVRGDDVADRAAAARADGAALVFADIDDLSDARSLAGVVDGIRVHLGTDAVKDLAVPVHLLRRPTPGLSLRENLGLARPVSRYAASARK